MAARNVISGNINNGVAINAATMNGIRGNYIGTDITGNAIIANRQSGVDVFNTGIIGNFIGGTVSGAGNLISGNGSNGNFGVGVHLSTNSASTVVQGNRIGTNAAGTAALPNANGGVQASNSNANMIGGTIAGAGNLISGNGSNAGQAGNAGEGVAIFGNSGANRVQGNLIGTNATGNAPLANTGSWRRAWRTRRHDGWWHHGWGAKCDLRKWQRRYLHLRHRHGIDPEQLHRYGRHRASADSQLLQRCGR